MGKTARDKANEETLILYGEEVGRRSITEEITLNLGSKMSRNLPKEEIREGHSRHME